VVYFSAYSLKAWMRDMQASSGLSYRPFNQSVKQRFQQATPSAYHPSSYSHQGFSAVENPFKQVVLPHQHSGQSDTHPSNTASTRPELPNASQSDSQPAQGFVPSAYVRETQQRLGLPDALTNPYLLANTSTQEHLPMAALSNSERSKNTPTTVPTPWDSLNLQLAKLMTKVSQGLSLNQPHPTSPQPPGTQSNTLNVQTRATGTSDTGFVNVPLAKPVFLGYREGKSLYGASKLFVLC
jgi:hypothetical protein